MSFEGKTYEHSFIVSNADFVINAGLNDAWFNILTGGQGFFITVFPDIEMVFLAWFTYDTTRPPDSVQALLGEAGHRWVTAFGPYSGNQAVLDIEITSGGIFDATEPIPEQVLDGTIILEFVNCAYGLFSYDIPSTGHKGEILVQRLADDNEAECEMLQP